MNELLHKFKLGYDAELLLEKRGGGYEKVATVPIGSQALTATTSAQGVKKIAVGNRVVTTLRPRLGKAFRGSYGRRIFIGGSISTTNGTAALIASSDLPPVPESSINILRITQNAAQSYAQWVCESGDYTPASKETTSAGLWVKNRSGVSLACQLTCYAVNTSHQCRWNLTIDPCDWTFITLPHSQMDYNSLAWGTDALHFIRFAQRDAGGDVWPAGAYLDVGPVYLGVRARPRFLLASDDCLSTNYHPVNITTRPASGASFRQIVEYYGFKGTMYCIPSKIGTPGYLTQRELLEMQDEGWAIGSHSNTHPAYSNRGLTSLGPVGYADSGDPYHALATNDDSAIYADLMAGIEGCRALGVWNPGDLFALPQGAWDTYVRSACIKAEFKRIRATSLITNVRTLSIGLPSGSQNTGSALQHGGWIQQADALTVDTETAANMQIYIDDCIAQGSTGETYNHGMSSTNIFQMDTAIAYLKTKSDAGLIDVITAADAAYDDGFI